MASRREVMARDRRRNSSARKRTHRATLERQKQQAEVLQRLWQRAREEERAQS